MTQGILVIKSHDGAFPQSFHINVGNPSIIYKSRIKVILVIKVSPVLKT